MEFSTPGEIEKSYKIRVDYQVFFELPKSKPGSQSKCVAKCKLCHRLYKFTFTTKGNLLKHLQTAHPKKLEDHKEFVNRYTKTGLRSESDIFC